ncbi:transcriptional regulator family: C2H2 zinc finger [Penicillium macrosclerotiorum]|uniref:transcriptional regulator family: C2H2 zinc finger n=1 Tax=Penicillium macrosclerotiorum TaxID=303699 RepID=UPI0025489BBB|nr:transcriptional regulator family: C2H2 zinc finger [Penicillium macrosclerotiorum]KAJ5690636.1 transcriptional regulator family: C2H2 zinc finger [Penicillium macrosclerotiorum]
MNDNRFFRDPSTLYHVDQDLLPANNVQDDECNDWMQTLLNQYGLRAAQPGQLISQDTAVWSQSHRPWMDGHNIPQDFHMPDLNPFDRMVSKETAGACLREANAAVNSHWSKGDSVEVLKRQQSSLPSSGPSTEGSLAAARNTQVRAVGQISRHVRHFANAENGASDIKCGWEGCTYTGRFSCASALMRHLRSTHVAPGTYKCPISNCKRAFGRKDKLQEHIRVLHSSFEYPRQQ